MSQKQQPGKKQRKKVQRPISSYISEDRQLRAMLRKHEGVRHLPYCDTVGKITIGVGRNLTDRGLAQDEITLLFENDIKLSTDILDSLFTNWHGFPISARHALISMAFNLGGPRLTKFKKMRAALEKHDFLAAAEEAHASLWAQQVPARAADVIKMFREAAEA